MQQPVTWTPRPERRPVSKPNPKAQTIKPCGCIITHFEEDRMDELSPCLPCGVMEAANSMANFAKILAAIATRIDKEREEKE